ncbi:MAG: bifunctional [glutamate--ammonia ligase]-adenylyl-L-tyrosine phosphorylase/[glutamate--ammonia-ligase] adenylyltransferase [Gammaproteobacteria bacterium]|nr:bifunctional [glutamate--ammonia ligase]-adenylyl-L-tyrosine phosphorylase/[glutamate--ammonia-ligase] adenylyltransferase [Gammaproteobacteria bacterium]
MPEDLRAAVRRYWSDFGTVLAAGETSAGEFDPPFLDQLCRVWAGSEFVAQRCVSRPGLLLDLVHSGDLQRCYGTPVDELTAHVGQAMQAVTDAQTLGVQLRRLRQREMVRIAWRDLARLADVNETMADLSALADACIQGALDWLQAALITQQGEPRDASGEPMGMLVLGMGKLGAGELNFSSDVDLIFAYPEDGETDRGKPNEVFFKQLGQQLIRALDETTGEGFVFRVDMRLRPFGQSGALASSFAALENYYQAHGRDWERYALIKVRVVAGDPQAGARLFEILRPFVFRRYLDYGAFEALREMKKMVESEVRRRGMANNVKLGSGGIREVEFIGQAFQLVRGGREPDLQRREIQAVLRWLGEQDYLPAYVVEQLLTAYAFLRNTEHRIQEYQDQQTHQLPEDERGRQRLAFGMGFAHWDEFLPVLRGHMTRVHSHFEQVFASPQTGHAQVDESGLSRLWLTPPEPEEALGILRAAGYREVEVLYARLQAFRTGRGYAVLSPTGRTRMDRLIPLLLGAVSTLEEGKVVQGEALSDTTLLRVLSLMETIASRTAYIALLNEHPMVLSQLVRLCAASAWIAQLLARHPILLDELFDPRSLYSPPARAELEADLQRQLQRFPADDLEQAMDALRQFKQASVLRVAAADVVEAVPLMEVSNHLTDIAEVIVQAALELAWQHLLERHGRPACVAGSQTEKGFAVVAYGKLGGLELGYGSDLDLVFLHAAHDQADALTDGPRPIADSVFYARLGQRIIHILTAVTPAGVLYEADLRLRPSGASGLLVTSLPSYASYQHQQAWTWEHQALVRARVVAGDDGLRAEFEALRREVLMRVRETETLRHDIVSMRERMRETLVQQKDGQFDLKQGRGGIADIEFMVQFGVLNWAHKTPALTTYTDNIRLLEGFAQQLTEADFLTAEEAAALAEAYRRYRAEVHRRALQDQKAVVADDQFLAERRQVTGLWRKVFGSVALDEKHEHE